MIFVPQVCFWTTTKQLNFGITALEGVTYSPGTEF